MYLKKVKIKGIRAIDKFEMQFVKPAGWHVIIGDNGVGKSTIIRSIALGLIGAEELTGTQPNWNNWLKQSSNEGSIKLKIARDKKLDKFATLQNEIQAHTVDLTVNLKRIENDYVIVEQEINQENKINPNEVWKARTGWFSAGYGAYRRFSGGNNERDRVFENPSFLNLASHLSLFGEDVALTETTKWLMNLAFKTLDNKISDSLLSNVKKLINTEGFLPHNTKLETINSEGVFFKDGSGTLISVTQMSDGYRSILSMTFELIRQLIRVYNEQLVFESLTKGKNIINLPGVVLIDEIDVHLHPTWQTEIGKWYTRLFPKIQFIVTTHSPLICRACENGTLWRLSADRRNNPNPPKTGQILGFDLDRLIHGNVLDAYGTEVFGTNITIPKDSIDKLKRLADLHQKSLKGIINGDEKKEYLELKSIYPTEKINDVKIP